MSDWPEDTFTENDVLMALEKRGLKFKNGSRYIVTQCPTHDDTNPSTQIFKDDWFVNCLAGCGRYHVTKCFPELKPDYKEGDKPDIARTNHTMSTEHQYKDFDLMEFWKTLPPIPREVEFKTIPLEVLDSLGWRWMDEDLGMGVGIFIPYFDSLKETIPFAQVRHSKDSQRRFTFLKDARPTCYGTWNVAQDNHRIFIVEGASDCAVLDYAAVPWIGLPSASSAGLLTKMAQYCSQNGIELVYAGDRDDAGNKLREALDLVTHYRLCQVPAPYKDWGDFLVATDIETVQDYAMKVLMETKPVVEDDWVRDAEKQLEAGPAKQQPTAAEPAILY